MSTETIVDAEIVDEPTTDIVPVAATPTGTTLLRPLAEPAEVREAMVAYQQTLDSILDQSDWQAADGKSFVKKSGWRKIAKAFGLSVTIISEDVTRDDDGQIVRAKVIARAAAPNGQVFDGDGYCSIDEPRFQQERGRKKLENDLPATAATRAMNRAISSLVGFGEVSADEVDKDPAGALPAWAAPIDQAGDHAKAFRGALGQLVGADKAPDLYRDLITECDGLPAIVAAFILKAYEARA